MQLYVNGKQGEVHVNVGETVTLKVTDVDPDRIIDIMDVAPIPDQKIASGTTTGPSEWMGVLETTVKFETNKTLSLRAVTHCYWPFPCFLESNTVVVVVGEGTPPLIPGGFDFNMIIILAILFIVFLYADKLGLFSLSPLKKG